MTITSSGNSRYLPQGRQWILPCLLLPIAMFAGAFAIHLLTPEPGSDILSVAAGVAATAEDWEQLLFEGGDEKAGEQLFFDPKGPARCGACHKAYGRGSDQGPNLMMAAKTPRHLLVKNILDPNDDISTGFQYFQIETTNGRSYFGKSKPSTNPEILGLILENGRYLEIEKSQIETQRMMSPMPSEYGRGLSLQQLRDVITFLMNQPINLPRIQRKSPS